MHILLNIYVKSVNYHTLSSIGTMLTNPSSTSNDEATNLSKEVKGTGGDTTDSLSLAGLAEVDDGRFVPVADGKSSGGSSGHPNASFVLL